MTRLDLANNVASNLGDPTFAQFSLSAIEESLQDAYNIIVATTLCLQKSINFPQIPNQVYYRFGDYFDDILAISAIFNYNTNRWLIPVSRAALDEMRWDWEIMNGEPQWFNPENWRYCSIIPHNASATSKGFCIFYRAKADVLTNQSIPSLPPQAIQALEFYATKDQFESIREFIKAADYKKKYLQKIPEIRRLTRQLAFADKVNVMAPAQIMGTFAYTGITDDMWIGNETPQGTKDGVNTVFTLAGTPNPTATLLVIENGQVLAVNTGYTLAGNVITFTGATPPNTTNGDTLRVWYQT